MSNFFNKADSQLQRDVEGELSWDPSLTSDEITVVAKDGIITLRQRVRSPLFRKDFC